MRESRLCETSTKFRKNIRGVVANVQACNIVVSDFEPQSCYYELIPLRKV